MLKKIRRRVYVVLIILFILVLAGAIYLSFFYTPKCQNYDCWQKHMSSPPVEEVVDLQPFATGAG